MNKRIGLVVLAMLLGSIVTGCQSRMRPTGNTTGTITRETAVVENQLSNGIVIAYMSDTAPALEMDGEEGQGDNTVNPMEEVAHMMEAVTGAVPVSIGGEDNMPEAEFSDGISINANDSGDRQPEVNEWLSDLGYNN